MPVAVIKDVKAPIEAYEATCRVLGLEKGGPGPKGCMFSWSEVTENGFCEIGVFDSEENAKADIDAVVKAQISGSS